MTRIEADGTPLPYTPPEVLVPNERQVLTVFTPPDPSGGILIHTDAGNFVDTDPRTVFDDVLEPEVTWITSLWSSGVTIVSVGLTGWNGGHPGGGLFRSYSSPEYTDDTAFSWPERDAEWIVQKVRRMTLTGELQGDGARIGWAGQSSGAVCGMAVGIGPDRRRPSGSAQVMTSTLLRFVVAIEPPVWWPAYDQAAVSGVHFPLGGSGTVPAPTLGDVPLALQIEASPFAWATQRLLAGGGAPALYLAYDEPVESTDFRIDAGGAPVLSDTLRSVHPYWHGVLAANGFQDADPERWARQGRLVAASGIELPRPDDVHDLAVGSLFDAVQQPDLRDWVLDQLGQPAARRVEVDPIDPASRA